MIAENILPAVSYIIKQNSKKTGTLNEWQIEKVREHSFCDIFCSSERLKKNAQKQNKYSYSDVPI